MQVLFQAVENEMIEWKKKKKKKKNEKIEKKKEKRKRKRKIEEKITAGTLVLKVSAIFFKSTDWNGEKYWINAFFLILSYKDLTCLKRWISKSNSERICSRLFKHEA